MAQATRNIIFLLVTVFGITFPVCGYGVEVPNAYIEDRGFEAALMDTIPPSQALAPGTAKVAGVVIHIHPEKSGDGINFKLKVERILGIGASTPPIGTQDTLEIASVKAPRMLTAGEHLKCLIRHRKVLAGTNAPEWELTNIFSSEDD